MRVEEGGETEEDFLRRKWQRASSRDALFRFYHPFAANLPRLLLPFLSLFFLFFSLPCPFFAPFLLSFLLALTWLYFRVPPPSFFISAYHVYTGMLVLPRFDFFHLFFTILLDTLCRLCTPMLSSLLRICLGVACSISLS